MNNVGRTASKNWLSLVLIFLFTFSVSLVGARFVRSILVSKTNAETQNIAEDIPPETSPSIAPAAVEFQSLIEPWATNLDSNIGVLIYDLDREETSASYHAAETFPVSGLTELLLAYDGYRQIDAGLEDTNTILESGVSYGECLDNVVKANDQTCSEILLSDPDRLERVTNLIAELGMSDTKDLGEVSSANDLSLLLRHIWKHNDLSLDSWARLQDSLLGESTIGETAEWRQGLPKGFSTAHIYSKASGILDDLNGSWTNYSDLALADFVRQDRHFAIIVLGENVSDLSNFSRLGTLIEGKVIEE